MIMANPKPYGNPSNAPLKEDGSDFPCKGAVNDGAFDTNVFKQGSSPELSFTGQAVHGGGSCQISLTTDKNPTKDSVWKVIKSIQGGCPARTATGNLGDSPDVPNPDKYDFTIPKELAAGEYTLAWTWFNHVGNREMYMNCAAITVEGSGGSKDHLDSLPDMFVANVGNNCETAQNADLEFPNAGKDVSTLKSGLKAPLGSGCQTGGSGSGGSDGGAGDSNPEPSAPAAAPTDNSGAQPTQPPATPTPVPGTGSGNDNGVPQIPGGAFITVSQPAASQPSATQAPEVPAAPETPAPETPDNGSGEGSGEGSGSDGGDKGGNAGSGSGGFAAGTACTSEGEWNCIGGSSFQRCASGAWTTAQQVSSGVTCTPGQGADIGMNAKRGKKTMRRAQRHSA
jgi:hypothetical protein